MFRIKLPQRKRCYPLLFPINMGAFSTWSFTNCSPTRKYYYGTEGYYLQVSLRRPQGKGLLIRHGEGRLKSKNEVFIKCYLESLCSRDILLFTT